MRTLLSILLSGLLSGTILTALSPLAPGPQEPEPGLSKPARAASKKLAEQMEGAWRLDDMQLAPQLARFRQDRKLEHVGYCLIAKGYISIEFHLRLLDSNREDRGQSLVSGLHRFQVDGTGRMTTTTVIATNTSAAGVPEFEAPGTKRRYDVTFQGDRMVLTRDDGHRLVFEKLHDGQSRFDIFGRPVREKKSDEEEAGGEDDANEGGAKKDDGG